MAVDTASQVAGDRLAGVPLSSANPGRSARDQYEYGTITPNTRQGRYKAFATAFSARPAVIITPMRPAATGTILVSFLGTPNLGSFQSHLTIPGAAAGAGSINCFYFAFGQR